MSRALHLRVDLRGFDSGDEASSPSLLSSDSPTHYKSSPNCHICGVTFGLTQRRHFCGQCGESVCAMHAMRRESEEDGRVCDRCMKERLTMRMKRETGDVGFEVMQRLERLKEEKRRKVHEGNNKEQAILGVQKAANQRVVSSQQKLEDLELELTRETDQRHRKEKIVKELKAGLKASKEAEHLAKTRLAQVQSQLDALKEEIRVNNLECEQILTTTDHRVAERKACISSQEAWHILCSSCRSQLSSATLPTVAERMASFETLAPPQSSGGCAQSCLLF